MLFDIYVKIIFATFFYTCTHMHAFKIKLGFPMYDTLMMHNIKLRCISAYLAIYKASLELNEQKSWTRKLMSQGTDEQKWLYPSFCSVGWWNCAEDLVFECVSPWLDWLLNSPQTCHCVIFQKLPMKISHPVNGYNSWKTDKWTAWISWRQT